MGKGSSEVLMGTGTRPKKSSCIFASIPPTRKCYSLLSGLILLERILGEEVPSAVGMCWFYALIFGREMLDRRDVHGTWEDGGTFSVGHMHGDVLVREGSGLARWSSTDRL